MTRIALGTVLAFGLALGGCVQQQVMQKENLLSAAGFAAKPADTPQRAAFIRQLPPHKFVRVVRPDGRPIWFYADPTICACLYAGDTRAYDNYKHEVFEKHLADEREMTAQMNADAALDWSMWGPWAPYYGY